LEGDRGKPASLVLQVRRIAVRKSAEWQKSGKSGKKVANGQRPVLGAQLSKLTRALRFFNSKFLKDIFPNYILQNGQFFEHICMYISCRSDKVSNIQQNVEFIGLYITTKFSVSNK
jgi:hypothetical protein